MSSTSGTKGITGISMNATLAEQRKLQGKIKGGQIPPRLFDKKGAVIKESDLLNYMEERVKSNKRGRVVEPREDLFEKKTIVKSPRDMLHFVRNVVKAFRKNPPEQVLEEEGIDFTTYQWAGILTQRVQYFDCNEIKDYVYDNLSDMYPSPEVPPSEDAILPAEFVGLYVSGFKGLTDAAKIFSGDEEITPHGTDGLIMCSPVNPYSEPEDEDYGKNYIVTYMGHVPKENYTSLSFCGAVNILEGTWVENFSEADKAFDPKERDSIKLFYYTVLRTVCGLLQTINTPSFVKQSKKAISPLKRAKFKKATGKFSPDSWNMVSWNVGSDVELKAYEEGGGIRQAVHFRRGHWRKAQEEHPKSVSKDGRWMTYVHGYSAGHPAFGVKKSYHLPKKEK